MPAGVLSATRYDEGLHVGSSALLGVFVLDNVLVCFAFREGNGWIFRVLHCCAFLFAVRPLLFSSRDRRGNLAVVVDCRPCSLQLNFGSTKPLFMYRVGLCYIYCVLGISFPA